MFSNNGEISKRQMKRMLVFDLLGITTILLPKILAENSRQDGIFAILAGTLLQELYLFLTEYLGGGKGQGIFVGQKSKAVLLLVRSFYFVVFIMASVWVAVLLADMIQTILLKEESIYLLLACLMILAGYGISRGLEGRARIYEVLYLFLLVPLFIMLLLACKDVRTEYWCPIIQSSFPRFMKSTAAVYGLLHISSLIYLMDTDSKRNMVPKARQAVACIGAINGVIYLILLGVFQYHIVAEQDYSAVVLMSMIRIPGGFLKRQDAIMMAVWFFTLYALLNSFLYQAECQMKALGKGKSMKYTAIVLVIVIYVLSVWYHRNSVGTERICGWIAGVIVGISNLIILFLLYNKNKKEKIGKEGESK